MIYRAFETLATLADFIFLLWFIPDFLDVRFDSRRRVAAISLPILFLVFQLTADKIFSGFDILPIAVIALITLVYSLMMCEKIGGGGKAILAASLFIIIEMFTGSLLYMALDPFMVNPADVLQGAETPARLIYLSVAKLCQFVIFKLLILLFKKSRSLDRRSGAVLLVFWALNVLGMCALMVVALNNTDDSLNTPILIMLLVLLLTDFAVYFFIRQLMEIQRTEYEYKMLGERMSFEHKRSEEAKVIWDNIRKIKHDLKNHFTALKSMLEQGRSDECAEYIDSLYPKIESMDNTVHTDNSTVDYLINTKIPDGSDINVMVLGSANILPDVEEDDFISLLGNILDNAFEAVSRVDGDVQKRIELRFIIKNHNRIILCRNTVSGSVLEGNSALHSTKSGADHGLGHMIIASVAEKYGGFVSYSESDSMFSVQIVIPCVKEG